MIVVGFAVFPGGFPDGLTIEAAKPLNAANDWVIANQRTNAVFVHFLVPLKNGINTCGRSTRARSRASHVGRAWLRWRWPWPATSAGWRKAILAGLGFLAIGVLGMWADSLDTLALILLSVAVALAIGDPGRHPVRRGTRPSSVRCDPCSTPCRPYPRSRIWSLVRAAVQHRRDHRDDRHGDLRVAAGDPADQPGDPAGARETVEAALAFGVTKRQLLRKVQLPLAKPVDHAWRQPDDHDGARASS